MTEEQLKPGQTFPVQFVWQLPDGDFIRAVFEAEVREVDRYYDRYLVRLNRLLAGRQEAPGGELRAKSNYAIEYWARVDQIPGNHVRLAFEAADGRPLRLRLATLTGEHSFFTRYNPPPEAE